ncbi:hypothetical protein Catovirus_1_1090 [Catovirus CTV1]|uniref:Uncharacterized protein n=1 Tax=Catovirus CTV1 TaxID=1977631 RepID=A0A1V0SBD0_9VIRU|nr:hypothetical protein Catovirus_1_1090 [Catovirus CTV1]
MNIKTIILVIIFIGVLIFIYFQFSGLRSDIHNLNITTKNMLNENTIIIKKQIQNQLDGNIEKIKFINSESIQQVRKMCMIHNEPIKKSSDCYTENDSEYDRVKPIKYLSDSICDTKNGPNGPSNDFYMSHDEKLSKTSPKIIDNVVFVMGENSPNDTKNILYRQSLNNMIIGESEKSISGDTIEVDNKIIQVDNDKIEKKSNNDETNKEDNKKEENKETMENKEEDIEDKKEENTEDKEEEEDDEMSVMTGEVLSINITNLQPIQKYKLDALKKIAKFHKISMSIRENGRYKSLNKNELYAKIKDFLEKNK